MGGLPSSGDSRDKFAWEDDPKKCNSNPVGDQKEVGWHKEDQGEGVGSGRRTP